MPTGTMYRINGTELAAQPEMGRWEVQEPLGIDGSGKAIYAQYREFRLQWAYITAAEYQEILGYYEGQGTTGTVVVDLPRYGYGSYAYYPYSGVVLRQPELSDFFNETYSEVTMIVARIVVE